MDAGPGVSYPLGVTLEDSGLNVAVYSHVAERVSVCLYDEREREIDRASLPSVDGDSGYGRLEGVGAGQLYGLRVDGPYDPSSGARCNPNKLLMDPYARAITRAPAYDPTLFGYGPGGSTETYDGVDSAMAMP